jgi:hypothetical protein
MMLHTGFLPVAEWFSDGLISRANVGSIPTGETKAV